jgi:hypothetical protein
LHNCNHIPDTSSSTCLVAKANAGASGVVSFCLGNIRDQPQAYTHLNLLFVHKTNHFPSNAYRSCHTILGEPFLKYIFGTDHEIVTFMMLIQNTTFIKSFIRFISRHGRLPSTYLERRLDFKGQGPVHATRNSRT